MGMGNSALGVWDMTIKEADNFLADFYVRLALLAMARGQDALAREYFTLANEVLI